MILLDATTKSLEVVLGTGVSTQVPIVANWVDLSTASGVAVSGIADTTTVSNNTTAVTAVAAPAASTTRQVKFLSVRNLNTSAVTVKVQVNNSGTKRVIVAVSLSPDDTLTYMDGRGVQVQNANGEQKASSVLINLTTQVTGILPVANGGTALASGTSGGVLGYTAAGVIASSIALTASALVLGGGAGATPTPMGSLGTTTTVLHGNAAGAPTFAAVSLTADVSGTLPVANGGTGKTSLPITSTLTDGATPALDASLVPSFLTGKYRLAAAGDRTIAVPSNATDGQKIVIEHFASGAGRTLALNTGAGGFRFGSDITSLTQTASGKTDYIGCVYNGTDSKWDVVAVTKGF